MGGWIDDLIDQVVSGLASEKLLETREFPIASKVSSIAVSGQNGRISWLPLAEGAEPRVVADLKVTGNSSAAMQEYLRSIKIEDLSSGSQLILKTTLPPRVRGVRLAQISFTVYARSEQIKAFQATTTNGRIEVKTEFSCALTLQTTNGRISVDNGAGQLLLSTSNGAVELNGVELTDSSTIATSNGRIEGSVSFGAEGSYVFETSNGRVNLRVPQDPQGSFRITTSNGTVDVDLGGEKIFGQRTVDLLRGPGPSVRIITSNGNVSLLEHCSNQHALEKWA